MNSGPPGSFGDLSWSSAMTDISPQHHYKAPAGVGPGLPLFDGLIPAAAVAELDQYLSAATADPGLSERAARLSCFNDYGDAPLCVKTSGVGFEQPPENGLAESPVSDLLSASNAKKRKAASAAPGSARGRGKEIAAFVPSSTNESSKDAELDITKCGSGDSNATEGGASTAGNNGGSTGSKKNCGGSKSSTEAQKDYIHVRARRGEATDSHSLAERVRREKISQRMKLLQDLVPGCNKVVGKAVMLDEIINYVQSLQRQVEFLSMKLATMSPQLDFNSLPNLLLKEMNQPCGAPMLNMPFPLDACGAAMSSSSYGQPQPSNPLHCSAGSSIDAQSLHAFDAAFCRSLNLPHPLLNSVGDAPPQAGAFWQGDLQSIVNMDVAESPERSAPLQSFNGSMQTPQHMKLEL